jgi:hypothetical protein
MRAKKITMLLTSIAVLAIMVTPVFANGGNETYTSNLYATRQLIDVGDVVVERTSTTNLRITYMVDEGCYLLETHLEVVTDDDNFPMTGSGNPKIGKFTYATDPHDPMTTQAIYDVTVNPTDTTFYIAAHAVVSCGCKRETAWGDKDSCAANMTPFPGNSWAFYFEFPPP